MEPFFSLLFYLFLVGVLLRLCRGKGEEKKRNNRIILAYFIFFIVSAIRYGIGNDYEGYAPECVFVANWFKTGHSLIDGLRFFSEDYESAHVFFCWLTQWMDYPFVGLYFIYSFIQACLLFLILNRNDDHYWGLFLLIIGEFMFCSWDAIRQFTAVYIIIYSYGFVKDNSLWKSLLKFLLCVAVAWLFHHSSLYVLPVFLLRWVKINRWILLAVMAMVTIASVTGVLQQYQEQVTQYFEMFEEYSAYYNNDATMVVAESLMYRIRLLMVGIIYIIILYYYPKGNPFNELLLTIGVSLFIFANNSLTLMRISWYFWTICLVMIGPSIREIKKKNLPWLSISLVVVLLFIFSHDVLKGSNTRGCQIYTTIFNNDLNRLPQH